MCIRDRFTGLLLRHTTTRGVRIQTCGRATLDQEWRTVPTAYGPIRVKVSRGRGVTKRKPEYEDVRAAAQGRNVPFEQVWQAAMQAADTAENG